MNKYTQQPCRAHVCNDKESGALAFGLEEQQSMGLEAKAQGGAGPAIVHCVGPPDKSHEPFQTQFPLL